ncbi:MAG: hypothetical protein K6G56_02895, partial [Clostridiales bacterium]|nr:hypothetical protein [Clostridiales bacterium]
RAALKMLGRRLTGIPALFALPGTKISTFETLRGFQPKNKRKIRGYRCPRILLYSLGSTG